MAGKPYRIREMKVIVDYLVEHKAFGEIRGRKRWMDLANSQMTTRTWQSLKETFLKRILPDIHNPYFKLTMQQVRSFKEGKDVTAEQNNKLEIRTASEGSSNIEEPDNQVQDQDEPTKQIDLNKENQEESTTGETKCSKLPPHSRSSVETVILDHEEDPKENEPNTKSMRDCIIYTEPLTPILQQVLDDFNTDDDEEQLKIDEDPANDNTETEAEPLKTASEEQPTKDADNSSDVQDKTQPTDTSIAKVNGDIENQLNLATSTQTQKTNSSTDSTLPNNQEVLVQEKPQKEQEANPNQFTETQQNEEINNVDKRPRQQTPPATSNTNKVTSPIPEKQENLCLKSVNLFAEQFVESFIDSDSSVENQRDNKKKEAEIPKIKEDVTKDVVLLKSHSESDSELLQNSQITKTINKTQTITKTRSKAMANVFGFSSGGVPGKHKSHEKRSSHRNNIHDIVISESEWTSESDSEFVSPPRARRNRPSKKYVKPPSARILSLEEEGGLFVVHGKKIYPLVKDGKMIKNYVNYFEEPDVDDDEDSYWKMKYAQEKIKTAELTKLLENKSFLPPIERNSNSRDKNRRKSAKKPKFDSDISENEEIMECDTAAVKTKETSVPSGKSIKIKFSGNQKEVQLEGHWSQIHPVLQQVVNIFQKDSENNEAKKETQPDNMPTTGKKEEVPIIIENNVSEEAAQQKRDIAELEASIFKEIEEKDKEESGVLKRSRGRPKKSEDTALSPAKIPKLEEDKTDVLPKRAIKPKRNSTELTQNLPVTRKSLKVDDSEEIRYKFPSPMDLKSNSRLSTRKKYKPRNLKYPGKSNETMSSPENKSVHSESTQGYQDSDVSLISRRVKRRRKHSFSSLKNLPLKPKVKRFTRRRSHPNLNDMSSDSSNSSFNISLKTTVFKNSSLNSDVYKSESYQVLMAKAARPFKLLESIDETKPVTNVITSSITRDNDNSDSLSIQSHDTIIVSIHNDELNSSNMSMPVSPELSIVEKLSVNKSLASSDIDFPTLNEIQVNKAETCTNNKYLLTEVDASIPLMQQDCSFEIPNKRADDFEIRKKSEEINSPAQTLHAKLRDLILNSAKKIANMSIDISQKEQPMEIDTSNIEPKKIRKKRSSTPQKRRKSQVTKKKNGHPVIEERVEFCLNGDRHSCPPSVLAHIENIDPKSPSETVLTTTQKNKAPRRKKDIIKVKILRPKSKTPTKRKTNPFEDVICSASNETSLGTNESGIFIQTANDTIDLIHNHSETCLHAHDCIDNSVELLPAANSHITLHSDSNTIDEFFSEELAGFNIPEEHCNSDQDAGSFKNISSQDSNCQNSSNVMAHVSDLSIFTEDLSDEAPTPIEKCSKWFLLSEDDTTSTNLPPLRGGLTANLNHIFPIVCSVPDLSTITEVSKDADSRKPTLESDRAEFNS